MDLDEVEKIADYTFSEREHLASALQSAQRDRDDSTGRVIVNDGNRRLAKLGYGVIELNLRRRWYESELDHRMQTFRIAVASLIPDRSLGPD